MIRNTFVFLNGISYSKEKHLWKEGVKDWDDFVKQSKIKGISAKRKMVYDCHISQASRSLLNDDSSYFASTLPLKEHWRLYDQFKDECLFLDIETSGVDGYITCMTLFDGINTMTFVKNHNLDFAKIKEIISRYKMIVTYNGNTFDLPFLEKYYPGILPEVPCWDLRHASASLGLSGGLKEIEKQLGIKRANEIVERLHGGDPIKLWRTYLATGDPHYIGLLVEYNQEDAVNLKFIADKIYARLVDNIA